MDIIGYEITQEQYKELYQNKRVCFLLWDYYLHSNIPTKPEPPKDQIIIKNMISDIKFSSQHVCTNPKRQLLNAILTATNMDIGCMKYTSPSAIYTAYDRYHPFIYGATTHIQKDPELYEFLKQILKSEDVAMKLLGLSVNPPARHEYILVLDLYQLLYDYLCSIELLLMLPELESYGYDMIIGNKNLKSLMNNYIRLGSYSMFYHVDSGNDPEKENTDISNLYKVADKLAEYSHELFELNGHRII